MGYITYHRRQYVVHDFYTGNATGPYKQPPRRAESLPTQKKQRPIFKPTWLVRVADMQVIKGSEVYEEDYCALSYSWNQSGDIVKDKNGGDEDYIRIDEGKHVIIDLPSKKVKIKGNPRGRRRSSLPERTRFATFNEVVQQFSLDFGIQYIWFDQMCINQEDPEEKKRELQQMHQVYQNSLFTIAFVPDLAVLKRPCPDDIKTNRGGRKYERRFNSDIGWFTEWARRIWCLEELAKSKLLVYLTSNAHCWSDIYNNMEDPAPAYHYHYYFTICDKSLEWSASTALFHAHRRLSTKAHDRIFSLANIFPAVIPYIDFNYEQPVLHLMHRFYSALAKYDIRILLFGVNYIDDSVGRSARINYGSRLPSWVGMVYTHMIQVCRYDISPVQTRASSLPEYTVDHQLSSIRIKCDYIHGVVLNSQIKKKMHEWRTINNIDSTNSSNKQRQSPSCPSWVPSSSVQNLDELQDNILTNSSKRSTSFALPFIILPEPVDDKFDSLFYPGYYGLKATHRVQRSAVEELFPGATVPTLPKDAENVGYLSLTDNTCKNIFILSELSFTTYFPELIVMPIVTRTSIIGDDDGSDESQRYKSVGICFLHYRIVELYNDIKMRRQFEIY